MHTVIDDHSPDVHADVHADETDATAIAVPGNAVARFAHHHRPQSAIGRQTPITR